jgi:hypothetical protein
MPSAKRVDQTAMTPHAGRRIAESNPHRLITGIMVEGNTFAEEFLVGAQFSRFPFRSGTIPSTFLFSSIHDRSLASTRIRLVISIYR